MTARYELHEQNTRGPDVAVLVNGLAKNLFRRHVRKRAAGGLRKRGARRCDDTSQAKVDNASRALFGDDDVGRLDVAMNDVAGVSGGEAGADLNGQIDRFTQRQWTGVEFFQECLAFVIGHDDENLTIGAFVDAIDDADVGMVESGGGTGFAKESFAIGIAGKNLVRQKFERDRPLELQVECLVHDAHSAGAEFFENTIVGDRLAYHEGGAA